MIAVVKRWAVLALCLRFCALLGVVGLRLFLGLLMVSVGCCLNFGLFCGNTVFELL